MRVSCPARWSWPESCDTPRLSPVKSLIRATRAIAPQCHARAELVAGIPSPTPFRGNPQTAEPARTIRRQSSGSGPPAARVGPPAAESSVSGPFGLAVHGDDGRAAESQVVLESSLGPWHLSLLGLAAQLPVELGALREPGGAQRMSL